MGSAIIILDKALGLFMLLLNTLGASQKVSEIIGRRIAEGGRDWTPEEKAEVESELDAAEKRADAAITAAGG
jgi:hypothetical protein